MLVSVDVELNGGMLLGDRRTVIIGVVIDHNDFATEPFYFWH